jgi:hypothetical protein
MPSFAQQDIQTHIENIVERFLENADENYDYSELYDRLLDLYEDPIDLNTSAIEEWQQLFFLSPIQINEILEYRSKYRGFKSIYELKCIQSLDFKTLSNLQAFVQINEAETKKRKFSLKDISRSRHELLLKTERVVERQQAYTPEEEQDSGRSYYPGNPYKYYVRYNQKLSSRYSLGITMEKDAGEEFFKGSQKNGFDYYSAHLFIQDVGPFKAVALGDYTLNMGQGLIFYTGFGFGKNPMAMEIYKATSGLKPYRSVNENLFLRGLAVESKFRNISFIAFYSDKSIDASSLQNDSLDENNLFSSFYTSGYHRTENELAKKKTLREQLAGVSVRASFPKFKIAANTVYGKFGNNIVPGNNAYQLFDFRGNQFFNASFDYSYAYKSFFLFGEHAFDGNAFAHLVGSLIHFGSDIQGGVLYRKYAADYTAVFANAFRESGDVNNEEGFYFALTFSPFTNVKVNLYLDQFHFPWLDYQRDLPSHGKEFLMDVHYTPSYYKKHNFRIKYQEKEKNIADNESVLNQLALEKKLALRYDFQYNIYGPFSFRSRIEYSCYQHEQSEAESGILSYQDISYISYASRLKLSARFAVFNTPSYDSRIYVFENDVPTAFSIASFYGRGSRYYFIVKYAFNSKSSLWFKIAQTQYYNKDIIGSGLSEIEGNKKTDVRVLLKLVF